MLERIQQLDEALGLASWSCREVALITIFVLFAVLCLGGNKGGIRWYSLLHAAVTGYLSLICVWTSYQHNQTASLCDGPLTNFHRLIPAITMGYGIFDIFEAFAQKLSKDFFLHGVATFFVTAYLCEYNVPEVILPFFLMEISTVHLVFMKTSFLSETAVAVNMAMFVLTFFLFRLMISPYLWWGIVQTSWEEVGESNACLPWHFKYLFVLIGVTFNGLNGFWGIKIVLKVLRKVSGKERMKEGNSLKES